MALTLAREMYCIHDLLISFLILVSHIPLFVLVPGHSVFLTFLIILLLLLGSMSLGGHKAFPRVGGMR